MVERQSTRATTSVMAGIAATLGILLLGGWWMTGFIHPRPDNDRFPTNDTLPATGISIPVQPSKSQ